MGSSTWFTRLRTLPIREITHGAFVAPMLIICETSRLNLKPSGTPCPVNACAPTSDAPVANAPIVNREALIEALRAGRLGGVAMDIHYQEPVADDDELLSFGNVVLTPRMAGSPRHNGLKDFEQLITGLAREIRL